MELYEETNYYRAVFLSAASRRSAQMRSEEREELANMITDRLVKAWNAGQKK